MDRIVALKAAVALVAVGVVFGGLSIVNGVVGPCHDDLAFQGPTTEVKITADADQNAVEVTHAGGDALIEDWTLSVTAVASAGETGATNGYPSRTGARGFRSNRGIRSESRT